MKWVAFIHILYYNDDMKKMIKTIRVMLIPNKRLSYFNMRILQDLLIIRRQEENYENGGKFISDGDLRKEFTQLKKTNEYAWLKEYQNEKKIIMRDDVSGYGDNDDYWMWRIR